MFNFLAYGTTAQVTRAVGAGARETADRLGAQAFWLSFALGTAVAVALGLAAEPLVGLIGVDGQTAEYAVEYLQIAVLGLPFSFLLLGGQGYFRGISDLRTPLLIEVVANGVNIVLVTLFVYGFGWGIQGSAAGTAISQAGMGLAFLFWMLRVTRGRFGFTAGPPARLLVVGRHLFVRTVALYASFLVAGAAAARFGDAALGAHQIAIQLWYFLALAARLRRDRGPGDRRAHARRAATQTARSRERADDLDDGHLGRGFAALMLAFETSCRGSSRATPPCSTGRTELWPIFALMQPLNGAVFALDGILIGAGDGRYLMWSMLGAMRASARVASAALAFDWGIVGVWSALLVLICVRLAVLGIRFTRRRWLVTGWA